jgi:molybdate transport system substrate-binding protein
MNLGIQRTRSRLGLAFAVLPGLLLSLPFRTDAADILTIASAASVRFAMADLAAAFRISAGTEVTTVFGASGALASQIRNGAPFDVFVSADMDYPDSLHAWGLAADLAKPYAYGTLVLWTLRGPDPGAGLSVLLDSAVSKAALADPKRAPYGREAVNALRRAGLYDKVLSKLVYGNDISQVTQYVLTGNADIGFSAKSVVLSQEMQGKGKWKEVDSTLYDRIAQGAVVTKYGHEHHQARAEAFLAYLYSESARTILAKYGYRLP